jgi:predicted GH43/DUF377 family glycosyl hydrolase
MKNHPFSLLLIAVIFTAFTIACGTDAPQANDLGAKGVDTQAHQVDIIPLDLGALPDTSPDTSLDVLTLDLGQDNQSQLDTLDLNSEPLCQLPLAAARPDHKYQMDGWSWTKSGVLIETPADTGAMDGYLAPSLVRVGQGCALYFTVKQGMEHSLMVSLSDDCSAFAPPSPVLGIQGAYPSVRFEDGRYRMWYGGGNIDLAESDDGISFQDIPDSTFWPGEPGDFDGLSLVHPNVAKTLGHEAGYTMYYTGFDGADYRIGRAKSDKGLTWTRDPDQPVLSPVKPWENRAVAAPMVTTLETEQGLRYLMWYAAYDTSVTDPGPYRVALATSEDGLIWKKEGVSLDLAPSGPDAYSTRGPAVLKLNHRWLMVYCGLGDDYIYRLMSASSTACF